LLDTLLNARDSDNRAMSDQQLHDEILTFFLAGHETAALSLTWATYLLALHPGIQDRIREEAHAFTRGRELSPEDASKLRWTSAVVKEAMRLYPPVWSLGRQATADTTLGGHRVAQGTDIWICLHRLHRDERWHPQPDGFLPERWLGKDPQKPFTYLPFGVGPRVCIGQHFAAAEAILGLAAIVSRFRLTLASVSPAEPSAWITLRPAKPILLKLSAAS
jgi:cytochrome P450